MLALELASAALSNRYMPFLFWARKRQLVRHSCPADRHASRRNRRPTTEWGLFFSDAGGVDCRAQCRDKQDSVQSTPGEKTIQGLRSSEGMGTQPDVERPTPCNIASSPCSAPVISLFWQSGEILQMSVTCRHPVIFSGSCCRWAPSNGHFSLYFSLLAGSLQQRRVRR